MANYSWINFEINLKKLSWLSWFQLGECAAKCKQISNIPLSPAIRDELHLIYLAKGVHATTAIEGNTLSEEQVRDLIQDKLKLPPSKEYLEKEVENIIEVCNDIVTQISKGNFDEISIEQLCHYNYKVLKGNVPRDESAIPGQIREHSVVVGNVYRAPDTKDVAMLLDKFCEWMNSDYFKNEQSPVLFAILQAVAAHLYIAWIHPFGDGNGRVARLLEFAILLKSGVPSPAAHLLSNHYNMTRAEYYRQLDKASKTGDPLGFFAYAIQGFLDGLEGQLDFVQYHVIEVCWREFIYERFSQIPRGKIAHRRRQLALNISAMSEPVNKDKLLLVMSKEYKDKTPKTLARDLNKLEEMKLVVNDRGNYIANKDLMLRFLPFSASQ